jgi:HD-GYP domain-containing protein (c-di-GMP phosphodiesterase class II)
VASELDRSRVRLAELVASLSLGIDLGFGQPMEHVLRQCLIALRLADELALAEVQRGAVYYTALLVNVGCHSDAHEQAKWFGDDIAVKATKYDYDARSPRAAVRAMSYLGGRGNPPLHRLRVGLAFAVSGRHDLDSDVLGNHAAIAASLAQRLELPDEVSAALACAYERWDGHGWPDGRKGDAVSIVARVVGLAEFAEVSHRLGGVPAVRQLARERSGKQFDPALCALVLERADEIFAGLDEVEAFDAVIDAEPSLAVTLSGARFDASLQAIADFVDVKSPYTLGHSRAVSELAAESGRRLELSDREVRELRRSGLVHDLGRLGVSNAIWDKRGPLARGEWERVRMHPYLTDRMLHDSESLAALGQIAAAHCERLDGSGYPSGLSGAAISRPARILGAADAYQAMCEPRPHRDALTPDEAAAQLRAEVGSGRLDADAVDAVLGAVGHRVARRREGPAGLTPREIDVLRLLARGLSNKEIARELVISPKTASNHVEHIYAKIDASNRATASLFAMQHGLLSEFEMAEPVATAS